MTALNDAERAVQRWTTEPSKRAVHMPQPHPEKTAESTPTKTSTTWLPTRRFFAAVIAIAGMQLMATMDGTIAIVALPKIQNELSLSRQAQLVLDLGKRDDRDGAVHGRHQLHTGDGDDRGEESARRQPRRGSLGRSRLGGLFRVRLGHVNCSLRGFSRPSLDSPLCIVESRHKNLPYSNLRDLLNAERGHRTDNDDRGRSNTLRTDLFRRVGQSGPQSMLGRRRTLLNNYHRCIRRSAAF